MIVIRAVQLVLAAVRGATQAQVVACVLGVHVCCGRGRGGGRGGCVLHVLVRGRELGLVATVGRVQVIGAHL